MSPPSMAVSRTEQNQSNAGINVFGHSRRTFMLFADLFVEFSGVKILRHTKSRRR